MKSSDYNQLTKCIQSGLSRDLNETCRKIICDNLVESNTFWSEHSSLLQALLSETRFEMETIDVKDNRDYSKIIWICISAVITGLYSMIPTMQFWSLSIISSITVVVFFRLNKIGMKLFNQSNTKKNKNMAFGQRPSGKQSTQQNHECSSLEERVKKLEDAFSEVPKILSTVSEILEKKCNTLERKYNTLEDKCNTLEEKNRDLQEIKDNFETGLRAILDDYYKVHKEGYSENPAELYDRMLDTLINSTRYQLLFYKEEEEIQKYFNKAESDFISEPNETPALIIFNKKNEIVECLRRGKLSSPKPKKD